jgi:hypothetical protein
MSSEFRSPRFRRPSERSLLFVPSTMPTFEENSSLCGCCNCVSRASAHAVLLPSRSRTVGEIHPPNATLMQREAGLVDTPFRGSPPGVGGSVRRSRPEAHNSTTTKQHTDVSLYGSSTLAHPLPPVPGTCSSFDYSTDLGWFGQSSSGQHFGGFFSPGPGQVDMAWNREMREMRRRQTPSEQSPSLSATPPRASLSPLSDRSGTPLGMPVAATAPAAPMIVAGPTPRVIDIADRERAPRRLATPAATEAVDPEHALVLAAQRRAMTRFDLLDIQRRAVPHPTMAPSHRVGVFARDFRDSAASFTTQEELNEVAVRLRVQGWAAALLDGPHRTTEL